MAYALTSKGQITIPKEIRDHLDLKPGNRVKWFVDHHGTVFLLPERSITELKGFLKGRRGRIDDTEEPAAEAAVERDKRSRRRA